MNTSPENPASTTESATATNGESGLPSDTKHTNQNTLGFLGRLKIFLDETEASVSWIVGFITLAGSVLFLINYVDRATNRIVSEKISPYERLLSGQILVREEIYDDAIPDLEVAFKQLGKKFSEEDVTGGRYYQIIDSYLLAMVNSKSPELHEYRFREILKLQEENNVSFLGWHYLQIGWYYFRIGHLQKAQENFSTALEKYKGAQNPYGQANSYWGLTLTSLCQGDLDQTRTNYQSAYALSSYYSPENTLRTIEFMDSDAWYIPLISFYDIEDYLSEFAEIVQETEEIGGVIRGS